MTQSQGIRNDANDPNILEKDLRAIPGVVACALSPTGVDVLLDPSVDGGLVRRRANLVIDAFGGLELNLLIPRPQRPKSGRPRVALVTSGASLAMTAALLPLAFGSLPPSLGLGLSAAPPARAGASFVSRPAGNSVSVERVAPAIQTLPASPVAAQSGSTGAMAPGAISPQPQIAGGAPPTSPTAGVDAGKARHSRPDAPEADRKDRHHSHSSRGRGRARR